MMIRRSGAADRQIAYSTGRFVGPDDAFVVNQPMGVSPFGGLICSPGCDYAVEVFPDGSGLSWFSGFDITMPNGMGKAWYLKDLESEQVFSPFYGPMCENSDDYEVSYLPGQVTLRSQKNKIICTLTISTVPGASCELWRIKLANVSAKDRTISFTTYVEPCVAPELEVKYLERERALIMRQPLEAIEGEQAPGVSKDLTVFHTSTLTPVRYQTEKSAFFGEGRTHHNPMHVEDERSAGSEGQVKNPVASFTVEVDLPIEGEAEFAFCFGVAQGTQKALEIVRAFTKMEGVNDAIDATRKLWTELCQTVHVSSSDRVFDALVNTWLPYEAYTGWIRERSEMAGLDPSRVADLLKRVNAFAATAPEMFRDCLLNFAAGLSILGVYSPDAASMVALPPRELLWLSISTAKYVGETGDVQVLSEPINLNGGPALTLREHCERAIRLCLNSKEFGKSMSNNVQLEQALTLWSFLDDNAKEFSAYLDSVKSRRLNSELTVPEQRSLPRRVRYLQSISPSLTDKHVLDDLLLCLEPDDSSPADVGTACALYSVLAERTLGLSGTHQGLTLNLDLPQSWFECDITRRYRGDTYRIHVLRSASHHKKGMSVVVDGEPVLGNILPHFGDKQEHEVDVVVS